MQITERIKLQIEEWRKRLEEEKENNLVLQRKNEGSIFKRGEFLWSNSNYEITNARRPDEFDKETFRDLEYVCQEEIRLAIKSVVYKALNIDKNALFIEIGRFFGWKRNTQHGFFIFWN